MWGLFSRDPASSFPYEIGECVAGEENRSIWKLHKGKKRQNGEDVSVFVCDGKETPSYIDAAKSAVKKLKTLRHPCILTYLDSLESDRLVYLVTEPVTPLLPWLRDSHPPSALSWGLLQVTKALSFLNNEGEMCHHNVCSGSVFVTRAGDWKVGGVEYTSATVTIATKAVATLAVYNPPEAADPSKTGSMSKWSGDMWGLGCLIWELFNGQLDQSISLRNTAKIPRSLTPIYTRLVGAMPASRPNPREVLQKLQEGEFCRNSLVEALLFLEEIQIKDPQEKHRFFSDLTPKLDNFPDYVSKHKVLPALLAAHDFAGVGSVILSPMFKIGKLLDEAEYQQLILPCVVKLFTSSDRATRLKLLQQMSSLAEHMKPQTLNDQVFPQLASGFLDTNPTIREHTVKSILFLAPKLNYNNLNVEVLKHFARLQARDDQGGIRTNTTVCLGKVSQYLHPDVRQKCLVSAFTRATRDTFPPARSAGVMALAATQQYYTLHDTATRILPTLCTLTLDPERTVRDAVFRVMKGYFIKLEKVSEDPTLKEDMEREVKSVSLTPGQQPTWTGWAVGAITSKFYKSSISNSSAMTSKATPSPSPTPPTTPSTLTSSLASSSTTSTLSKDWGEGSGWGDMDSTPETKRSDRIRPSIITTTITRGEEEEEEEEAGDGWEDQDEWGNLEGIDLDGPESSTTTTTTTTLPSSISTTAPSSGWGLSENSDDFFNSLIADQSQPPSSTSSSAPRSPPVLSSGRHDGGDGDSQTAGWDQWGQGGGGGEGGLTSSTLSERATGDDSAARREREEKRLRRQREIEAKRAARAGPMKLGAKKIG